MDWHSHNVPEAYRMFSQRFELYCTAKALKPEEQVATFLLAVGEEGLQMFNSWTLSEDEGKKWKSISAKFSEQIDPSENFRISRLKLSKFQQKPNETLDQFINRCQLQAKTCQFEATELNERLLELVIAGTPIPDLQKELLGKPKGFTIKEALEIGRRYEATMAHVQTLKSLQPVQNLDEVRSQSTCRNCGGNHTRGRKFCPARNDSCGVCQKLGHWAKCCLSKTHQKRSQESTQPKQQRPSANRQRQQRTKRQMHVVDENGREDDTDSDEMDNTHFDVIETTPRHLHVVNKRNEAYVRLQLKLKGIRNGQLCVKLKVDTGAQANTLPFHVYRQFFPDHVDRKGKPYRKYLKPTQTVLSAYNGSIIRCAGVINIPCRYKSSEWTDTPFYVVDVPGPAILGLASCENMSIVTLHCAVSGSSDKVCIKSTADLVAAYPEQFDSIGEFKTVHKLSVNPNVPPRINPPRRIPIAIKDKIKAELNQMLEQSVIMRIQEPTEWVSSLTYVTKRDGSLRVCLDPKHLNKALLRPHHHSATTEELNHKFAQAQYFTKLDAKAGYWSIKLDPDSQKLTTFQTPFGRFCFQRLPFGLSVSQDLFQLEMDRIIEKCPGACGIADDVVVYGATEQEHDENLINFMNVAREHGLKLNSSKCEVKKRQVTFFGNIYSNKGMRPDPKKVADLRAMPAPTNRAEVQQFLGFITYLSRYIRDFSTKTAALRDLLNKDTEFIWETHHQKAFDQMKQEVSEKSLLRYYNPQKEVHLHCDASLQGVGAALLQPDNEGIFHPVAYASKSLTPTEQRYACIERELLSIVFGVRRFHTYLFGRSFHVITDHRPLVMIVDKPLTAAPPRLQRMLVELQGYNFILTHRPGAQHQLADGLSRLPSQSNNSDIELNLRVDNIQFSDSIIEDIRAEIELDSVLTSLRETVIYGWPQHMKDLPCDLRPYWGMRDTLSIENGLIYKGKQLLIPVPLQPRILQKLHTAHMGQDKTKLLAKTTVFWLNMCRDIERMVKSCDTCQRHQPAQCPEPLMPHDIPTRPWSVVAADVFHFNDCQWMLIVDYYSKYPVVRKLPAPCPSSTIVRILKETFGEMGIPDKLVTDNGKHFDSASFRDFAKSWNFNHTTTSPNRPQGNGFVERQIRTIKQLFKKGKETGTDLNLTLLMWRTTPVSSTLDSPAQLLQGRQLRATLPVLIHGENHDEILQELTKRQKAQKRNFDRHAQNHSLRPLYAGQPVRMLNTKTHCWEPGTIQATTEDPRSYIVANANGAVYRRNRQHLREVPSYNQVNNPSAHNPPTDPVAEAPAAPRATLENASSSTSRGEAARPSQMPATTQESSRDAGHTTTRSGRVVRRPDKFVPG